MPQFRLTAPTRPKSAGLAVARWLKTLRTGNATTHANHDRQIRRHVHPDRQGLGQHLPLEDMPKWLEFYRRQRDNFPKADGAYDDIIRVLEEGVASLQAAE